MAEAYAIRMKWADSKSWVLCGQLFFDIEEAVTIGRNYLESTTVNEILIFSITVGKEPLVELSGPIEPSKE